MLSLFLGLVASSVTPLPSPSVSQCRRGLKLTCQCHVEAYFKYLTKLVASIQSPKQSRQREKHEHMDVSKIIT